MLRGDSFLVIAAATYLFHCFHETYVPAHLKGFGTRAKGFEGGRTIAGGMEIARR